MYELTHETNEEFVLKACSINELDHNTRHAKLLCLVYMKLIEQSDIIMYELTQETYEESKSIVFNQQT